LRQAGWTKPILLLEGFFHEEDLPLVRRYQIDIAVHNTEQIDVLTEFSLRDAGKIRVHLKINGGMNRLGFKPDHAAAAFLRLQAIAGVEVVDMVMHFANADDEFNVNLSLKEQLRRFALAQDAVAVHAPILGPITGSLLPKCLSNSAAILLQKGLKTDWIRAGIMLYGGSPTDVPSTAFGLRPGMTLRSELIAIQELEAGDAVGYGSRFVAPAAMRIGIVACGYADGYPRQAPNGTPVLVDGVHTVLVGRVSMDMLTVDLTPVPQAHVGSSVVLWGEGLPIDDVAHAAGTIGYELMCAVAQRVPLVVQGTHAG
jgi:alanine racemase